MASRDFFVQLEASLNLPGRTKNLGGERSCGEQVMKPPQAKVLLVYRRSRGAAGMKGEKEHGICNRSQRKRNIGIA